MEVMQTAKSKKHIFEINFSISKNYESQTKKEYLPRCGQTGKFQGQNRKLDKINKTLETLLICPNGYQFHVKQSVQ